VDLKNLQAGTVVAADTLTAAAAQAAGANLQTGLSQSADSVEAQAANGTIVNNAGTVVAQPVPTVVAVSNTIEAQAVLDGTSQEASVGAAEKKSSAEPQPALNLATNAQSPAANPLKSALDVKGTVPSTGLPENIQPADVIQQIMRQMNARLQSEPTSMHLQLNPKELGFIDVQMVRSAQGVSVSFITEQASTGRLLETQINNLRQSLTDSGIQLSSVNINQQGQPGQQGGSFKQTPLFTQYVNRGAVESETRAENASKLQTNQGTGLQMVDYRV
jgi:flagellar hook-length control protein FliK